MTTYHKIPALWARESERPHAIIPGKFRTPEVELLQDIPWHWTEKVDGMNIRVVWDGHRPTFLGRTDAAQLPAELFSHLTETFTEEILEQQFGETPVVLYGEGYGAGIQKGGGNYRPDKGFILFDVRTGNAWLRQADVADIAQGIGCPSVPLIAVMSLRDMVHTMSGGNHLGSFLRETEPEGYVGRPLYDLRDRRGNRIIVKLIVGEV